MTEYRLFGHPVIGLITITLRTHSDSAGERLADYRFGGFVVELVVAVGGCSVGAVQDRRPAPQHAAADPVTRGHRVEQAAIPVCLRLQIDRSFERPAVGDVLRSGGPTKTVTQTVTRPVTALRLCWQED